MKKAVLPLLFFIFLVLPLCFAQQQLFSRGPAGPLIPQDQLERTGIGSSSVSLAPYIFILIAVSIGLFYNKKPQLAFVALIFALLLFLSPGLALLREQSIPETAWQRDLQVIVDQDQDLKQLTLETTVFDYSDPIVQQAKDEILAQAKNQKEAVQLALNYVFDQIEYEVLPNQECFASTASTALVNGKGDCDIQSIANVGLLRSMGIPARMVGGCVWSNPFCDFQFAVYPMIGFPIKKPIFQEIDPADEELFRVDGTFQFPRTGALHAWLEYYDPVDGWVGLEATSGSFIQHSCYQYDIEVLPDDIVGMCTSDSLEYWRWCGFQQ